MVKVIIVYMQAYLECSARVRRTCVRLLWRIELCSAKYFGLLLCVTTVIVTAMSCSGYINSSSSIYSVVKQPAV